MHVQPHDNENTDGDGDAEMGILPADTSVKLEGTTQLDEAPSPNMLAPRNVRAAAGIMGSNGMVPIQLTWEESEGSDPASRFEIHYASQADGQFLAIGLTDSDVKSFTHANVAPNQPHFYKIVATAGDLRSPPSEMVQVTPQVQLSAVSSVTATAQSGRNVVVAWMDPNVLENGFFIYRKPVSGSWAQIHRAARDQTLYRDTSTTPGGSYVYAIVPFMGPENTPPTSQPRAESNVVTCPNLEVKTPILSIAPVSESQARLSWNFNYSANEDAAPPERIYLEKSVNCSTYAPLGNYPPSETVRLDSPLTPGTMYCYRAYVTSGGLRSTDSNVVSIQLTASLIPPQPAAPVAQGTSSVMVSWTSSSFGAHGIELQRSSDGANFTQVTILHSSVSQFRDAGLAQNTLYYYRLRSFNGSSYSSFSQTVNVRTLAEYVPITAPTNLRNDSLSTTNAVLSWNDNSADEIGFQLERRIESTGEIRPTTYNANVQTTNDSVSASTTYIYRIRAYRSNNDFSGWSNELRVTTPAPAFLAPSNLGSQRTGTMAIQLNWADNTSNETGFELHRSTDNVNFSLIASPGVNATAHTDNPPQQNTTYYYKIRAKNGANFSGWSNTTSIATGSSYSGPLIAPRAFRLEEYPAGSAAQRYALTIHLDEPNQNELGTWFQRRPYRYSGPANEGWESFGAFGHPVSNVTSGSMSSYDYYWYKSSGGQGVGYCWRAAPWDANGIGPGLEGPCWNEFGQKIR